MKMMDAIAAGQRRHLPHRTVCLDRDRAHGFTDPLQAGEVVGGRGAHPQASRSARRYRGDERRDDFDSRQEWWTGDALLELR